VFTSLLIASQEGCLEVVKFLVESGANINAPGTPWNV
jgi:ankyrin repeat protein